MLYRTTVTKYGRYVGSTERKRLDAAKLATARAVYAACEAQGLRDRPVAHAAMARVEAMQAMPGAFLIVIGNWDIMIERIAS